MAKEITMYAIVTLYIQADMSADIVIRRLDRL